MWWLGGVGRFGLGRVNYVGNLSINGVVAGSCRSHLNVTSCTSATPCAHRVMQQHSAALVL